MDAIDDRRIGEKYEELENESNNDERQSRMDKNMTMMGKPMMKGNTTLAKQ